MKRNIILILSVLYFTCCYSQSETGFQQRLNGTAENFTPLPPEVASFVRYGSLPVNLSSGTASVDIPIYTIKTKQLELPISLSYTNSGIRVNDSPGSIGLGWTLNAGGVISVQINGKQDARPGFSTPYKAPSEVEVLNLAISKDKANAYSTISEYCFYVDTQADMYSYSVSGNISGKFLYDSSNVLQQIPLTDRKIVYKSSTGTALGEFIITSENGTKYIFDEKIASITTTSENNRTGIHLTKIISADKKDSITFHYKASNNGYPYSGPYNSNFTAYKVYNNIHNTSTYHQLKQSSTVRYYDLILEKILFNGGEVVFSGKNDRKDHVPYRMTNIKVQSKDSNGNTSTILSCDLLNEDYFETKEKIPENVYEKEFYYRLKLTGVEIKGEDENPSNSQVYKFSYNAELLPPYNHDGGFSWEQAPYNGLDMWGYYNGVSSNTHLLQHPSNMMTKSEYLKFVSNRDANREVSEKYAKACSLEKIIYPTGGYTIFELESNRLDSTKLVGGLRVKSQKSYDSNNDLLEEREYKYDKGYEVAASSYLRDYSAYKRKYVYTVVGWLGGDGRLNPNKSLDYTYIISSPLISQMESSHPIHYTSVIEYIGGGNNKGEKKKYRFANHSDSESSIMGQGNSYIRYKKGFTDYSWARDQLIEEYSYKKTEDGYILVRSSIYEYEPYLIKSFITGLIVTNDYENIVEGGMGMEESPKDDFHWFNTFGATGAKKIKRKITTDYSDLGEITTEVHYSYDKISSANNPHQQVVEEKIINSDRKEIINKYLYPLDYSYNTTSGTDYLVNKKMRDANVINKPIETIRYQNTDSEKKAYDGIFYRYKDISQLSEINKLNLDSPIGYSGSSHINSTGYDINDHYELAQELSYYDNNIIKEIKTKDQVSTTYLWGYNGQYPIAEIKNATYEEVKNALGVTPESLSSAATPDFSKLGALRTKLGKAFITTYKYKPLVGLIESVDPREVTTTYEYDSFGRLKATYIQGKGHSVKKLLQSYDYNYQK